MFLVNSRFPLASATLPPSPQKGLQGSGPPSPEVTGAFCRVPSPRFTRSPRHTLPDHLCRFRVRAAGTIASRLFSAPQDHPVIPHQRGVTITPHPRHQRQPPGFTWAAGCALERTKPSGPPGYHCASPLLTRLPTCTEDPQTPPPQPHRQANLTHAACMAAGRGLAPARQHGRCFAGTGISTRHPSTTPVGLALGPDSPRAD